MLDFVINFNNIFNCFPSKYEKYNLKNVKESLENLSKDAKIRIVLSRILNGTFDFVFLNQISTQSSIMTLGKMDFTKPQKIKCHIIPIYLDNIPIYSLVLASRKSLKEPQKDLIELLAGVLKS
jgi:hypothetical protein